MLEPTDPTLILLSDARRKLPHGKGRGQMHQYRRHGMKNPITGERIYLECVWLPGGWATTPFQWESFLKRLNGRG